MTDDQRLWTTEETAAFLQVKARTLLEARSRGTGDLATIPYLKVGSRVRYSPGDVHTWLDRRRQETAL